MTRLSNRQYPMLKAFADEEPGWYMSLDDAHTFDQRPFRSMLIQKWVDYKPGRGFVMTKAGRAAWEEFGHTAINRKDPLAPLCSYFESVWGDGAKKVKPKAKQKPSRRRPPALHPAWTPEPATARA
jgi:hypothetical protein